MQHGRAAVLKPAPPGTCRVPAHLAGTHLPALRYLGPSGSHRDSLPFRLAAQDPWTRVLHTW